MRPGDANCFFKLCQTNLASASLFLERPEGLGFHGSKQLLIYLSRPILIPRRYHFSSSRPKGPKSRFRSWGVSPKCADSSWILASSFIKASPISSTCSSLSEPPSIRLLDFHSIHSRNTPF